MFADWSLPSRLPPSRLEEIVTWQRHRQRTWRSVPSEGQDVVLAGLAFRVFPSVFWPFEDSLPLIENMRIEPNDHVLDVGTGAGTIAIYAGLKGAKRVVAVDRNPVAVRAARVNAQRHGLEQITEVHESDIFDAIGGEQFDVITANLPWLNRSGFDDVECAHWDEGFMSNRRFFEALRSRLKPGGRAYYAQGNYGAIEEAVVLMRETGLGFKVIGERRFSLSPDLVFYAFEINGGGDRQG